MIGTPDNGCKTKFESYIFFEHSDPKKLGELLETPKVNKIKVFSKAINDLIGYPSLQIESSDSEYCISLNKQNCPQYVDINSNNIKRIMVSDNWKGLQSSKEHNIFIEFNGYIEIELTRRVNYDFVSDFINELELFIQLYYPDKFLVEEVSVKVGEEYYRLCIPQIEINRKEKAINKTVNVDLLEFLKNCYLTIPYRKSKAEFRNIPYIVMKTS